MRISKQTFRNTDYDRSKATAECGIFKISGYPSDKFCKIYRLNQL